MAFITTLEVIPYSIYERISDGYEDVTFISSADFGGYLDALLSKPYPPDFKPILIYLKHYLTFPYVQRIADIPFSFEEEFIQRVGTFFSYIDAYSEGYTHSMQFLVDQIKEVVDNVKNQKINLRFLTTEEFDERTVKVTTNTKLFAHIHPDNDGYEEVVVREFILHDSLQKSTGIGLFEEVVDQILNEKDRLLILHEMGVIHHLADTWGWVGTKNFEGNIESVDTNHTRLAKLLCEVFLLSKPDTIRAYLKDLRSRPDFVYPESVSIKIKEKVRQLGIVRISESKKKG